MNPQASGRGALLRDRNFRWLMSGSLISLLGDQFSLIALPWLVLKMTGDTLVLGTVLAVMSVPRALFILLGGALVDRYSPKRVLMLTKHVSTLLLALLGALVLAGRLELWMVYALALGLGLASAFSLPSATSMMPHAVAREHLQAANGVAMGVRQLSMFAGPLLAGLLIALFGDTGQDVVRTTVADARGIGIAFLCDAASFALSAWTLSHVVMRDGVRPTPAKTGSVWESMADGLRYCRDDRSLRLCFSYWAAVAFFISGPIQVALPVLAARVGDGAAAFGALAGAHGAGTLAGAIFSGARPGLRFGSLGATILLIDGVIGALFLPLGIIAATWQGVLLLLVIGTLGGFLQVKVYTWLQRHVSPPLLGRTMAIFMFIFMGIAPVSSAITGWLMRFVALPQLFAVSGVLLLAIVVFAWGGSGMRSVTEPESLPKAAAN